MAPADGSGLRIDVVDEAGAPVVSVAALALRPIDPAQLDTAQGGQSSLFQLDWVPVQATDAPRVTERVAVLGDLAAAGTGSRIWTRWNGRWPAALGRRKPCRRPSRPSPGR